MIQSFFVMKTFKCPGAVLFTCFSLPAFAGTGNADDGLGFVAVVTGILFLAVVFLSGIDFIKKNGIRLIVQLIYSLPEILQKIKDYLKKSTSEYIHNSVQ